MFVRLNKTPSCGGLQKQLDGAAEKMAHGLGAEATLVLVAPCETTGGSHTSWHAHTPETQLKLMGWLLGALTHMVTEAVTNMPLPPDQRDAMKRLDVDLRALHARLGGPSAPPPPGTPPPEKA